MHIHTRGLGEGMASNSLIDNLFSRWSQLGSRIRPDSSPDPIPLNSDADEKPVKWVPDGENSWRVVYVD